jgi:hypothetical protein
MVAKEMQSYFVKKWWSLPLASRLLLVVSILEGAVMVTYGIYVLSTNLEDKQFALPLTVRPGHPRRGSTRCQYL